MADRLYRSRHDRIIGGVAGGIAENLDLDPTIIRIAWVVLALIAPITPLVYFILMFVIPEEPLPAVAPGTASPSGSTAAAGAPASVAGDKSVRPAQRASRGEARAVHRTTRGPDRSGAVVLGVLLVVVGAWFLVRQYLPRFDIGAFWPYVVIGLGAVLIVGALRPGGRSAD